MKRIYSLIAVAIMALVSMTTSAQVKSVEQSVANAKPVQGTLTRIGDAQKQTRNIDFTKVQMQRNAAKAESSSLARMSKAPAKTSSKAPANATWTSVGTGQYVEVVVAGWFGLSPMTLEVELDECNEAPGLYRMANPYSTYASLVGGTFSAEVADDYLYVHAENPQRVYLEEFNTGWSGNVSSYGYVTLLDDAGQYVELGYDTETIVEYVGDIFGKLQDGVITFPNQALLTSMTLYNNGNLYSADQNGDFRIILPGADVKDYKVSIVGPTCSDDNAVEFTIQAGADVAALKFMIAKGQYSASAGNLAVVAANGNDIEAGSYSFTLTDAEPGIYTVFVVGLDAEGNVVGGDVNYSLITDENDANWTSLGNVMFGENIIYGYYNNLQFEEYEVELQENNETPGLYRVKNPYAGWSMFAEWNGHSTGHNHYLYIHAENPEKVWIEESFLGLDFGDGDVSVASLAENFNGFTDADYGKIEDGKIVFPAKTILISEKYYNNGGWYRTNSDGGFYVTIPGAEDNSVKDVIDINALDVPMSSGSGINAVNDGDITEDKTLTSANGLFTMTITPSGKTTNNRFWKAGKDGEEYPQLRVYGGTVTINAVEGKKIAKVEIEGSNLTMISPTFTVNGLDADAFAAVAGCSAEANKLVWAGEEESVVIAHTANSKYILINSVKVTFAPDPVKQVYSAYAETASIGGDWGESNLAGLQNVRIESYSDNTLIVRAFMGVEGYDLKAVLTDDGEVKSLSPIIDGEEGDEVKGDNVLGMYTGRKDIYYAQLIPSYCFAENTATEGYLVLQGYFTDAAGNQEIDYYYLSWLQEPVYSADAVVFDNDANDGTYAFLGTEVAVDVLPENALYLHGWAGVEGYDLYVKVADNKKGIVESYKAYVDGVEVVSEPVYNEMTGMYLVDVPTGRAYAPVAKLWLKNINDVLSPRATAIYSLNPTKGGVLSFNMTVEGVDGALAYAIKWPAVHGPIVITEARAWDFTTGAGCADALAADTENWSALSKGRYQNEVALEDAELTANGEALEMTEGLLFTAAAKNLLVGTQSGNLYLQYTGGNATMTVPYCAEGYEVSIDWCSSGKNKEAKLTFENASEEEIATTSTSKGTSKVTVAADGDLKITGNANVRLYAISVAPVSDGVKSDATGINDVTVNAKNSTVVYNLAGQKVSSNFKGIVVKNGKKVMMK